MNYEGLNLVYLEQGIFHLMCKMCPMNGTPSIPISPKRAPLIKSIPYFLAVGYLFLNYIINDLNTPVGNAFQLSPSIIGTSLHLLQEIQRIIASDNKRNYVLYYTSQNPGVASMNLFTLPTIFYCS